MNRLSVRIFVAFFVTLLLVLAGSIAIATWTLKERDARAANELQSAAEQAAQALALRGRTGLAQWAAAQQTDTKTAAVILIIDDLGGEILDRPLPPSLRAAPAEEIEDEFFVELPTVALDLPGARPMLHSEDGEHFELVPVPRDRGPLAALGLRESAPALLLLALVVTALISGALARSITGPIFDLQATTESLAGGKLDARVPVRTLRRSDELGQFSRSLDSMAERLASLVNSRDELLRNVSHELRSPLTRMRLAIGLIRQPAQPSPEGLERIEREIERLDGLIGTPARLSAPEVRREAERLLAEAARVKGDAPVLRSQVEQLNTALQIYDKPIKTVFQSDGQTRIVVQRIGIFGTFTRKELQLKPGRYVVVGTREGFRDVRREINVTPNEPQVVVDVRCTELIS